MKLSAKELSELRDFIGTLNDEGIVHFDIAITLYAQGTTKLIGSILHSDEEDVGYYFEPV